MGNTIISQPSQTMVRNAANNNAGADARRRNRRNYNRNQRRRVRKTKKCIPTLTFTRIIRTIMNEEGNYRIQATALEPLQLTAEKWVTRLLEDAYMCTLHAGRLTLMLRDLELARKIRGRGR